MSILIQKELFAEEVIKKISPLINKENSTSFHTMRDRIWLELDEGGLNSVSIGFEYAFNDFVEDPTSKVDEYVDKFICLIVEKCIYGVFSGNLSTDLNLFIRGKYNSFAEIKAEGE